MDKIENRGKRMNNDLQWVKEQQINRTISSLNKNGINAYMVSTKEELLSKIEKIVDDGATVSCGGSMTLEELGIIEYLREGRYNFLDRSKQGLSAEEIGNIYRQTFFADAYFTGTNAITEEGELYNVDGNGNRVSAMIFGPKKVIVIIGSNKIVKNLDQAIERNKCISAPANAKRLNKNTPCTKVGYCVDCNSEERICCEYTVIKRQRDKQRMHVFIFNDNFGY